MNLRLSWEPPLGEKAITDYIVTIEPGVLAYTETCKESPNFTATSFWNHQKQAIRPTCAYEVQNLQPMTPYRFSITPVHRAEDGRKSMIDGKGDATVEGTKSNLTETIVTYQCMPPHAPGVPSVVELTRSAEYHRER